MEAMDYGDGCVFRNEFECSSDEEEDDDMTEDISLLLYDVQPFPETKGGVLLFGKSWNPSMCLYESCVVRVSDVPYELYGKVRSTSNWSGASKDIRALLQTKCIPITGVTLKKCRRSSWFFHKTRTGQGEVSAMDSGKSLPFIRVSYSSKYCLLDPLPPASCSSSLEAIVGTTYTAQERFLLQKQIQGLCWIKVSGCSYVPVDSTLQPRYSYCTREWQCSSVEAVEKIESQGEVPLYVSCIRTCTVLRGGGEEELAAVYIDTRQISSDGEICDDVSSSQFPDDNDSCDAFAASRQQYRHSYLVRNLQGVGVPRDLGTENDTTVYPNERQLLTSFCHRILAIDPDIIVGHKLFKDIQFILSRFLRLSAGSSWKYMGRLRGRRPLDLYHTFVGRFYCDIWSFCQGPNINTSGRESYLTYDLRELERRRLVGGGTQPPLLQEGCGLQRQDLRDTVHRNARYFVAPMLQDQLRRTLEATARVCYRLVVNTACIQVAFNRASVTGCPLSVAFGSNRYQPNEWFLMHVMSQSQWLIPDRGGRSKKRPRDDDDDDASVGDNASYRGGKVIDPEYGVHTDPVTLLDFTSMYPSIVAEYDLCFSADADDKLLPQVMRELMQQRHMVRQTVVRPGDKNDIRQLVLKYTANSMYGCTAFDLFRFHCLPLAARITEIGRQVLTAAARIAEELGFRIVYGDTDSVGLAHTSASAGRGSVEEFIRLVHAETKISIKVEAVFERSFFVTKKTLSYLPRAAVTLRQDGTRDVDMSKRVDKGLPTIVRTAPYVTKAHAHAFLSALMTSAPEVLGDLRSLALFVCGRIKTEEEQVLRTRPLDHFVMHVQLQKRLHEYQQLRTLPPHVRVAQWLKKSGHSNPTLKGESIAYVMCEGGEACHPDQLREHPCRYRIDFAYYMKSSVMRALFALCRAIDPKLPSQITGFITTTGTAKCE